jgi:hypothetical protein
MANSSDPLFSLKLRAFRCFRDEIDAEIRPLTLFFGFNQAGKSTLLRLLALLADSLQPGAGPLDLRSPSLRGATFKELGWMGREPNLSPWLTLTAPGSPTESTFRVQYVDKNGLVVNRLQLTPGAAGDKFMVDLDSSVERSGNEIGAQFAGHYRGREWRGALSFDSLFPKGLPEDAERLAGNVRAALGPLQRLQWLHANRLVGADWTRPIRCCRADGADLAPLLRNAPGESVLDGASQWLAGQEGLGNTITVRPSASGEPQLIHGARGREDLPLHLAGEGIRALLPILLCALWAEVEEPAAPTMLAVEEPEAHLHPTLQVSLFDRLVDSVGAGIPVALETHSAYILRAMQLAVLDGRLAPSRVGLHWVGQGSDGASTVTTIGIEPDAALTGWRPDLFEKEQELAHRILDLRWKREETQ